MDSRTSLTLKPALAVGEFRSSSAKRSSTGTATAAAGGDAPAAGFSRFGGCLRAGRVQVRVWVGFKDVSRVY